MVKSPKKTEEVDKGEVAKSVLLKVQNLSPDDLKFLAGMTEQQLKNILARSESAGVDLLQGYKKLKSEEYQEELTEPGRRR